MKNFSKFLEEEKSMIVYLIDELEYVVHGEGLKPDERDKEYEELQPELVMFSISLQEIDFNDIEHIPSLQEVLDLLHFIDQSSVFTTLSCYYEEGEELLHRLKRFKSIFLSH